MLAPTKERVRHVSASQIDKFFRCGESYRRRYIERDGEEMGTAVLAGNAFHEMAKQANLTKMRGQTPEVETLEGVIEEVFYSDSNRRYLLNKKEQEEGFKNVMERRKREIKALVPLFLEKNKDIVPKQVEVKQELKLPHMAKPIMFIMDLLTQDDVIHDYKYGARKKTQDDIYNNTGLTVYALAFHEMYGRPPKALKFQNYVSYTTPARKELKTSYQEMSTKRDYTDFEILMSYFDQLDSSIEKGVFLPPGDRTNCSPYRCSYFHDCRFVNQQRFKEEMEDKSDE